MTGLGKLLISTVIIASLGGCASHSSYQSASSKFAATELERGSSVYQVTTNMFKWYSSRLTKQQSHKHSMAVRNALESDYGVEYSWYEDNAMGRVKTVHGYPQGSGFCRVVFSEVHINGSARSYEETACKETGHPGWRFIRK